jgi:hypothetical protein
LGLHLKKQLLGMDVIYQARVVFIHHSKLFPGGTYVQAANSCGLLQQDDGKEIVHKDLQDLAKFQRKSVSHYGNQTLAHCQAVGSPMCSSRTTPTNSTRSCVQRKDSLKERRGGGGRDLSLRDQKCGSLEVTKVITGPPETCQTHSSVCLDFLMTLLKLQG